MPVITFTDTLITRAFYDLDKADSANSSIARYIAAHLAAVRAAAAVISARLSPEQARMCRPSSMWELLPRVAPELTDWAAYFDAGTPRRAQAERGQRNAVNAQHAEEMLTQARQFATLAEEMLHA